MERTCPHCGSVVSERAKFCRGCGKKIEAAAEIFCEECGAKCPAGSTFCEECGATLAGGIAPVTATADAWGDALASLTAAEEEERLADFEYERLPDGTVVIKGLKNKYALTVKVPDGVSVIAEEAFAETKIISVELPEGLTTIDRRAFFNCNNLTEVALPSSLMMICDEAFAECERLELDIPETVRILGEDILRGSRLDLLMKEKQEKAEAAARAEAEERARAEAEERARLENPVAWEENLHIAGDPYDHRHPSTYGFNRASVDWLNDVRGREVGMSNGERWALTSIALAKLFYFGIDDIKNLNTALGCLSVVFHPKYTDGARELRRLMESGIL